MEQTLNSRILQIIESVDYAIGSDDRVDVWGQEKAAKSIERLVIDENKRVALKFFEYHNRFRKEEHVAFKRECDKLGGIFSLADYGIENIYNDYVSRKSIKCEWSPTPMQFELDENDNLQLVTQITETVK